MAEVRQVVTVVFADVSGSTRPGERLNPDALRRGMGRYFDAMAEVIERHGGIVEKFIGDAVMAVFGIPRLHEDDPLRAVRAAGEMRQALAHLNESLERETASASPRGPASTRARSSPATAPPDSGRSPATLSMSRRGSNRRRRPARSCSLSA
jgi:class 3 adenylate cyclase